jgi:hypothetical protein
LTISFEAKKFDNIMWSKEISSKEIWQLQEAKKFQNSLLEAQRNLQALLTGGRESKKGCCMSMCSDCMPKRGHLSDAMQVPTSLWWHASLAQVASPEIGFCQQDNVDATE